MSGWRVVFLAGIMIVNLLFVLAGYDAITAKIHDILSDAYDNPATREVLACNTQVCDSSDPATRELNTSLEEIRGQYQRVFSLL